MADFIDSKEELYNPGFGKEDNDFIGFTFGGDHSSTFGIIRTSNGSRFNESLLPSIQDKTVQIPGGDGAYYFGSYYGTKQFNISIAFDSLDEANLRRLKQWLGDKKIKDLIFDESPYKVYRAKITGSATINHICFFENEKRIYKGEGSIQFTCYEPFAKIRVGDNKTILNTLEDYTDSRGVGAAIYAPTKSEWIESSGLLSVNDMNILGVNIWENGIIKIYNPGDLECDFVLTVNFNSGIVPETKIEIRPSTYNRSLSFRTISRKGQDVAIKIDSKSNLIYGVDIEGRVTGNVYNEYITSGHFFKIPIARSTIKDELPSFQVGSGVECKLEYRWLYY